MTQPFFDLLTPFGPAICVDKVISHDGNVQWVTFIKQTGICFWWQNDEIRMPTDWSTGRYSTLPFQLDPDRIATLDKLGRLHKYWRDNICDSTKTSGQ